MLVLVLGWRLKVALSVPWSASWSALASFVWVSLPPNPPPPAPITFPFTGLSGVSGLSLDCPSFPSLPSQDLGRALLTSCAQEACRTEPGAGSRASWHPPWAELAPFQTRRSLSKGPAYLGLPPANPSRASGWAEPGRSTGGTARRGLALARAGLGSRAFRPRRRPPVGAAWESGRPR